MDVRCPSCHSRNELLDQSKLSELNCATCGSTFNLLGEDETFGFDQPQLKKIGHFEVLRQIGVGSFGTVWEARDQDLHRTVAIKVPRKGQLSPTEAELFLREARAAAQLNHPNVVSVHEVGREDGNVFIVTDYVRGLTLADWLSDQKLTFRESAELCATISDALDHAHESGVVHRDLKPANILLDAEGAPHVTDFGLAKRDVGDVTVTLDGKIIGTPAYMSPEQAEGMAHQADRRSDVYSLGVILFELLTGEKPFRGTHQMILHHVISDDPPLPRKLNSRIPVDLETICLKCLEKDPRRRYQTAAELRDELNRWRNSEPIHARPLGRVQRAGRWCRRNAGVATLGLVVLLLLGLVAVVAGFGYVRTAGALTVASAEHARAIQQRDVALRQRHKIHLQLVETYLDRGLALCAQGDVARGVLWLGRCLQDAPGEADDLQYAVRANLAAWTPGISTAVASGGPDEKPDAPLDVQPAAIATLSKVLSHQGEVEVIAFSPRGSTLLTGSADHTAQLWEVEKGTPALSAWRHEGPISVVAFSSTGEVALTASADGTARLWDVNTGAVVGSEMRHEGPILDAALSPDGKTVLTASADHTARLWDAATGNSMGSPIEHQGPVTTVAFNPNGKNLVTGSADTIVRVWSLPELASASMPYRHESAVTKATFSPDGLMIATGSAAHAVQLWRVFPQIPTDTRYSAGGEIRTIEFSPSGESLLAGGSDMTARLWQTFSGKVKGMAMQHEDTVEDAAFSLDGKLVVTGSADRSARLWETARSRPVGPPLPHAAAVNAVAFSPDGTLVATASDDRTARIWLVPAALEGDVKRIVNWLKVLTGMEIDNEGAVVPLGDDSRRKYQQRLEKLGGPPLRPEALE